MRIAYFSIFLVLTSVLIFGCSQNNVNKKLDKDSNMEIAQKESGNSMVESNMKKLVSLANNYYRFDKSHFEKSLQEGKTIFLDFHANWCPVCIKEQPNIFGAFNELSEENVVGYQVHYKDDETNDEDEEMAKKYGITYQHTKVIIKDGKVALKSLDAFSKNKAIEEISRINGE